MKTLACTSSSKSRRKLGAAGGISGPEYQTDLFNSPGIGLSVRITGQTSTDRAPNAGSSVQNQKVHRHHLLAVSQPVPLGEQSCQDISRLYNEDIDQINCVCKGPVPDYVVINRPINRKKLT